MLTRKDVGKYIVQLTRKINSALKEVECRKYPASKISFKFHELSDCMQRWTYTMLVDGEEEARLIIAEVDGKPKDVDGWFINYPPKSLTAKCMGRIRVTKSENKWSKIKS